MEAPAGATVEAHARHAVEQGRAAWEANDRAVALRWLDRAYRLAPADPNVMLMLATICLDHDPGRAADLFRRVAVQHDVRQAWAGLATALLHREGSEIAAPALAALLSRHVLGEDTERLAARIAPASGWCGIHGDGRLEIQCGKAVRIVLDGVELAGRTLPRAWRRRRMLAVRAGRMHLLGSPIRLDIINRLAGCVEPDNGGVTGWAWHPADPGRDPELLLRWPDQGLERRLTLRDESRAVPHTGPLARPRSFHIPAHELPPRAGPLHVLGPDGKALLGSPLDPAWDQTGFAAAASRIAEAWPADPAGSWAPEPRPSNGAVGGALPALASMPASPVGADMRRRRIAVVIPVHDEAEVVRACLATVLETIPSGCLVVVVDDGSSEPELLSLLDAAKARGRIRLIRNKTAQGFPAAANAGMRAARGRDVVLLNSDTLVPPGWVERLRDAAYGARDIGTVTPISNEASILSYPGKAGGNPAPGPSDVRRLDRMAWKANGAAVADIPVGVGFCLYIRRDCLNATGLFRPALFAQGYGEENDFCLRAHRLGWRSVALPGLFVGHAGGGSFGPAAAHLRLRNGRILETLHPGHDALIQDTLRGDPLLPFRRRLDMVRWKQERHGRPSVILISHDDGGGVEQMLIRSVARHRREGRRPVVLRPHETPSGARAIAVHDGTDDDFANLVFEMPSELRDLLKFLRDCRPEAVEVHHLLHHPPAIYDLLTNLRLPYGVHVHDYLWVCPRVSLVPRDRYCGEPELHECEACIADHGHYMTERIPVAQLRRRSAAVLRDARAVIVPSADAARRLKRYVPDLSPLVVPHEDDRALPPLRRRSAAAGAVRVCLAGGIGVHKGYEIILACARDAAHRRLDLEFVVVGSTIDDDRMMQTGRVFINGRYLPEEAVELIRRQDADLGFIASIWPETWCLTLGEMWRAGLPVAAFDLGAPAERISSVKRGFLLPLGLSPGAINNALIAAARSARSGEPGNETSPTARNVSSAYPSGPVMRAVR